MALRRLLLALAREHACITPKAAGEVGKAGGILRPQSCPTDE